MEDIVSGEDISSIMDRQKTTNSRSCVDEAKKVIGNYRVGLDTTKSTIRYHQIEAKRDTVSKTAFYHTR